MKFNYYPHFFGIISQGSEQFEIIENYVHQCKILFRNFICKTNIKPEDINFDIKFISIFQNFIFENKNYLNISINNSFNIL